MKKGTNGHDPMFYVIMRPPVTGLFKLIYRPVVVGKDNIPDGRAVLAGTHTSNLDCFLLSIATKRCVRFLAKDELFKGPLKPIMRGLGAIPVNRRTRDHQSIVSAEHILEQDKLIGIFPEGTINRTDEPLMPFKMGAVKMAHDTSAPIVPFVISGKYRPLGGVRITLYEPMTVSDDLPESNERLRNTVLKGLTEQNLNISKDGN